TSNVCGSSIIHGPRDRLKNNIGTRLVFSASRTHCCHHPHTGEGRPSSTFFSAHASRHFTSTLKGNRELVVSRSPATSNSPEACQPPLSGVRTNDASGSKRRHHAVSKSRTWYSPRLPLELAMLDSNLTHTAIADDFDTSRQALQRLHIMGYHESLTSTEVLFHHRMEAGRQGTTIGRI